MNVEMPTGAFMLPMSFPSCERVVSRPAGILPLADRFIDLWGFTLEAAPLCFAAVQPWLDIEEQSRAARFVHQEDRGRFVVAHGTLRAVLSRYLGCAPDAVIFGRRPEGKPFLSMPGLHSPLTFSMAHSHGRVLIAVGKQQEIGADLEQVRAEIDVLKLSKRFYSAYEHALIAGLPAEKRVPEFFRHWVAKEAVLKGQGTGLQSLHDCELRAVEEGARVSIRVSTGSSMQPNWTVQWLSCGAGWEGAVACQGDCLLRDRSGS